MVDLSPIRTGVGDLDRLVHDIDVACRDTGFFAVVGHGIPMAAQAAALNAARELFDLPIGSKEQIAIGRPSVRRDDVADAKEAFDIGLELPSGRVALTGGRGVDGPNRWPELHGFRDAVLVYASLALEAALVTLRGIALALDLRPGFFDRRMRLPMCDLRLLHHPPVPEPSEGQLGCGAHRDHGTITLLAADGEPGLEVLREDGSWMTVSAPPDALVVNIGDLLVRWTNGRYVSTVHRVVSPTERDRYSIAFFVNPDADTVVKPLRSCVDAANPATTEPVIAGEYLLARLDEARTDRAADTST